MLSIMSRRMIFKWTSAPSLATILVIGASTILVESFLTDYLTARGLEYRLFKFDNFPSIPYLYVPIIGFLAVMLSSWMYLIKARSFVQMRPGARLSQTVLRARMLEIAFILMAVLTASLYLPYVLGSNWMLNSLFTLRSAVPSMKGFVAWYYMNAFSMMELATIWKYALSNAFSCIMVVVVAILFAYRKRTK